MRVNAYAQTNWNSGQQRYDHGGLVSCYVTLWPARFPTGDGTGWAYANSSSEINSVFGYTINYRGNSGGNSSVISDDTGGYYVACDAVAGLTYSSTDSDQDLPSSPLRILGVGPRVTFALVNDGQGWVGANCMWSVHVLCAGGGAESDSAKSITALNPGEAGYRDEYGVYTSTRGSSDWMDVSEK
jgi:hypothetical protein